MAAVLRNCDTWGGGGGGGWGWGSLPGKISSRVKNALEIKLKS